MATSAMS